MPSGHHLTMYNTESTPLLQEDRIIDAEAAVDSAPLSAGFHPSTSRHDLYSHRPMNHRPEYIMYDENNVMSHGMRWFYQDYTTIDWVYDYIKDRVRQRELYNQHWLVRNYDAIQGWIVLTLIGFVSGCVASFFNWNTAYLEDIQEGICQDGFWKRKEVCCPLSILGGISSETCESWNRWESSLNNFFHPILTTALALISTAIVSLYPSESPVYDDEGGSSIKRVFYASGSGIPEVKTILGGFVIHGFLGFRTLITKVFSLIFATAAGLMVGIQGPLVHISCAIGNVCSRLFQKYDKNAAKVYKLNYC